MLLQDAFEAAQQYLDRKIRPLHKDEIVITHCTEVEEGWAFSYDSRVWKEAGKISHALAGNGPVVVPRSGEPPYTATVFFLHRESAARSCEEAESDIIGHD